jgi:hypothetical protein
MPLKTVKKTKRVRTPPAANPGVPVIQGKRIPVKIKKNDDTWNVVTLEDGTVVRTRQLFIEVSRIKGQYDASGQPIYEFKSGTLIDVKAPIKLRRK